MSPFGELTQSVKGMSEMGWGRESHWNIVVSEAECYPCECVGMSGYCPFLYYQLSLNLQTVNFKLQNKAKITY